MGIFGKFFDQSREGKGVSKDDRKDKGLSGFFDIYITNFWKFTLLGLIYLLFCVPVVTMPAATAAFVYIQRNLARRKPVFLWSDFVETFTKYFWKAMPLGIVDVVLFALFFVAIRWYGIMGGVFVYEGVQTSVLALLGFGVAVACLAFYVFMRQYTYMLLVSFDFNYKQIYKNSFYLANLGFFRNLLVVFLRVIIVVVLWYIATIGNTVGLGVAALLIPLLVVSLRGYIINYNSFAVVWKHMVKPYEDEQRKKAEESGELPEEGKPIFTDMGANPKKK